MKRIIAYTMVLLMSVGGMVGCANTEEVGSIDGKKITKQDIQVQLDALEKDNLERIVTEHIDQKLLEEYYKGVEVTDVEVEAQLAIIKGQVGDNQWESYLTYVGQDESGLKAQIRLDLRRNKKIDEISKSITVTEEEIAKEWEVNSSHYQVISGDILFLDNLEMQEVAKKEGIDAASKKYGVAIKPNENVTFSYEGFNKKPKEMKVGDVVYTTPESGVYAVMKVVKISDTLEVCKGDIEKYLMSSKAGEQIDKELSEMYTTKKVVILGKEQKPAEDTEGEIAHDETTCTDPTHNH